MAKITLYLDTRVQKADGTYPVKLRLSHGKKAKLVNAGVSIRKNEWDEENGEVIGNSPMNKQMNLKLKRQLMQMQMALIDVETYRDVNRLTVDELMNEIRKGAGMEAKLTNKHLFMPYFEEQARKKNKQRTRNIYEVTAAHIRNFDERSGNLTFDDITPRWLEDFDAWLKENGMMTNSRSIQMRNIRTVMNAAIDERLTDNYPFRQFKIKHEATAKRSLSIEEMHRLWTMEPDESLRLALDIFRLSFALIGINTVDLFYAQKSQIVAGRLEYRREKTGKIYSVKLQPEALELIEKYQGEGENLLCLSEIYTDTHSFTMCWNRYLKRIDRRLSAYWARHTWATTAAELDIPKETIAGALGHSIGMDTTSIYIRFDQRKIDKANRQVLDAVING